MNSPQQIQSLNSGCFAGGRGWVDHPDRFHSSQIPRSEIERFSLNSLNFDCFRILLFLDRLGSHRHHNIIMAVVPEQTPEEVSRLQRTSSLLDVAIRDGVPYPPLPPTNRSPEYMNMLTRSFSVPNFRIYSGAVGPYRPSLPVYTYNTYHGYFPYRNYRGYTLANAYWYDRYYYFSPLYKRSMFPTRFKHCDYKANPHYWHYPHTFWGYPYQGKWFDYDNPPNYRPYYNHRLNGYARPYHYRSHALAHPFNYAEGMVRKRF